MCQIIINGKGELELRHHGRYGDDNAILSSTAINFTNQDYWNLTGEIKTPSSNTSYVLIIKHSLNMLHWWFTLLLQLLDFSDCSIELPTIIIVFINIKLKWCESISRAFVTLYRNLQVFHRQMLVVQFRETHHWILHVQKGYPK